MSKKNACNYLRIYIIIDIIKIFFPMTYLLKEAEVLQKHTDGM